MITIIHEVDNTVTVTEVEESCLRQGYTKTSYNISEVADLRGLREKLSGIYKAGTNTFLYLFASQPLGSGRIIYYENVQGWLDQLWADIVVSNENLEEGCSD